MTRQTPKPTMVRLDRLLANLGYGARRDVQVSIARGQVKLNGELVRDGAMKIPVDATLPQRLTIGGYAVDPPSPLVVMMHKPLGVVCSHKEDGDRVYDLLPRRWTVREPVLSTVGRLDKDTSGLLLITDDGDFLHRIISPKRHVPKRYVAELDRPLEGHEAALFAAGDLILEGDEKPLLPALLETLGPQQARLTVAEGRYHQVRRMFAAAGNHVVALHRDRIGALDLPADLAPGDYRVMAPADLDAIFAATPGPLA